MSIYVQIPVLRSLFSDTGISSGWETYGLLLFAVGLYLLGGFIEPFFQKYKRNRVCQFSIFMIIVILAGAYFMPEIFFSPALPNMVRSRLVTASIFWNILLLLGFNRRSETGLTM